MAYKKGFAMLQLILVAFFLLGFALVSILVYQPFKELNAELQSDLDLINESKAVVDDLETRYPSTMDGAFITVLGLLFILLLVSAYFMDENPLWIVVIIFLLIVGGLLAGWFSNIWEEFTDDPNITFESSFPLTNWVLDNFLAVILAMAFLVGLIVYAKGRL